MCGNVSMYLLDRREDLFDPLFSYDKTCDGKIVHEAKQDCVLHPTMMCNGVQNCPNCTDEIYEECMRIRCDTGKCGASIIISNSRTKSNGVMVLIYEFELFHSI